MNALRFIKLKLILVIQFLFLLLLISCSTPKEFRDKERSIQIGDYPTEIIYKVGSPKDVQVYGDLEVWQYRFDNSIWATRPYHYLVVWFQSGKVFRTTTYDSYSFNDFRRLNRNEPKNITSGRVYVCGGEYGKKFHSRDNCPGLNNCKGQIYLYYSQQEALNSGCEYCDICWK